LAVAAEQLTAPVIGHYEVPKNIRFSNPDTIARPNLGECFVEVVSLFDYLQDRVFFDKRITCLLMPCKTG
jgi:hypothetical protein